MRAIARAAREQAWRARRESFAVALAAVALLAGCAGVAPPGTVDDANALGHAVRGERGWWHLRIHVAWDREAEPAWHVDALLADRVVGPILARHEGRMPLWRFHRRAAPDEAGHRFSFSFYADREAAEAVRAEIEGSTMLARLAQAGEIERIVAPDTSAEPQAGVGATSDPGWPPEIRDSWPWFIMGVSRQWLALVDDVRRRMGPLAEDAGVEALVARYRGVDDVVTGLWRDFGQHAYLHHLSGVFGYRPLVIRREGLERF